MLLRQSVPLILVRIPEGNKVKISSVLRITYMYYTMFALLHR